MPPRNTIVRIWRTLKKTSTDNRRDTTDHELGAWHLPPEQTLTPLHIPTYPLIPLLSPALLRPPNQNLQPETNLQRTNQKPHTHSRLSLLSLSLFASSPQPTQPTECASSAADFIKPSSHHHYHCILGMRHTAVHHLRRRLVVDRHHRSGASSHHAPHLLPTHRIPLARPMHISVSPLPIYLSASITTTYPPILSWDTPSAAACSPHHISCHPPTNHPFWAPVAVVVAPNPTPTHLRDRSGVKWFVCDAHGLCV